MIPFTYATLDSDGEIVRKHRWSVKEAKWFKDNNPTIEVVKLEVIKEPKIDLFKLVGEAPF